MCVRCDAPVYIVKSQMCKKCYMVYWKTVNNKYSIRGPRPKRPAYERFIEKVDKTENCWNWTASKKKKGYGQFDETLAHRWSYEYYKGSIPDGLQIDHLCKNTSCVNPDHLEAVTLKENLRRQHGEPKLYCPSGHHKSWVNGRWRCYDCQSIYKKNKRHADAKK
jgi:hypothetical protein